jgi:hypothetical protein
MNKGLLEGHTEDMAVNWDLMIRDSFPCCEGERMGSYFTYGEQKDA